MVFFVFRRWNILGVLCFLLFSGCMEKEPHFFPDAEPAGQTLRIMSEGQSSAAQMGRFLAMHNRALSERQAREFADMYIRESQQEGVNADIAFAQMCLETDYLRFGGQVEPDQYNYCGLGATDDGARGASFPSIRAGVRAHVQHLKAYASRQPLNNPRIDPRFDLVERGSARTVNGLAGRWASDVRYAHKLRSLVARIRARPNVID